MRAIKFRAFNKQSKEITGINFLIHGFMFDNPIYEIMQFTGLLDKSGKEIYEGYVIQVYIEGYLQNKPYIVEDIFTCHNGLNNQDSYYRWDNNIEIIGNIYQNPELLK